VRDVRSTLKLLWLARLLIPLGRMEALCGLMDMQDDGEAY
jgi:hypothetical protein